MVNNIVRSGSTYICLVVVTVALIGCTHTTKTEAVSDWTLAWSDEFDGPGIDPDKWEVLTREDNYNNEKQYYLPEQATIVDGMLRVTI